MTAHLAWAVLHDGSMPGPGQEPTISGIRTIVVASPLSDAPDLYLEVDVALGLHTAEDEADHEATLRLLSPSGKLVHHLVIPVPSLGRNVPIRAFSRSLRSLITETGMHWLHVHVDGREATRVPVRVVTQEEAARLR